MCKILGNFKAVVMVALGLASVSPQAHAIGAYAICKAPSLELVLNATLLSNGEIRIENGSVRGEELDRDLSGRILTLSTHGQESFVVTMENTEVEIIVSFEPMFLVRQDGQEIASGTCVTNLKDYVTEPLSNRASRN